MSRMLGFCLTFKETLQIIHAYCSSNKAEQHIKLLKMQSQILRLEHTNRHFSILLDFSKLPVRQRAKKP